MSDVLVGQHDRYALGDQLPFWTGQSTFYVLECTRIYKKFAQPRSGPRELACIAKLVDVARMDDDEMPGFFKRIAWPLDYVVRDGRVEGVVLPRADPTYFDESTGYDTGPRPLANLMAIGAAKTSERLQILADLASAFIGLEYLDLVHGDLSENNATWRVRPYPSLLVLDCDGLRRMSDPRRGEATPDWRDPRLDAGVVVTHDQASDRWALGLVVWRVLVADLRAVPPTKFDFAGDWPPLLVPHLRTAFARPLSAERPPPTDWYRALKSTARDAGACSRLDALLTSLRDDSAPRFTPTTSPPSVVGHAPVAEIAADKSLHAPILNRNQLDELLRASYAAQSVRPSPGPGGSSAQAPRAQQQSPRAASRPDPPLPRPIEYDKSRVWSPSTTYKSRRSWRSRTGRVALLVAVLVGGAPWALGDTGRYRSSYDSVEQLVTDAYTRATKFMETGN